MTKQTKEEWVTAGSSSASYNKDYENASYKPEQVGDSVEGIYTGKREHIGENDSTAYSLISDALKQNITVWSSAVIHTKFKEIPVGSKVKISYLGKPSGKKYKDFDVKYVPGDGSVEDKTSTGVAEEFSEEDIPF